MPTDGGGRRRPGRGQLRATPLPSGWSVLGLLGHVRDSTIFWLHHVVLGHPTDLDDDESWDDDPAARADDVVADFLPACERVLGAVRGRPAHSPPGWWPEGAWGGYRQETVLGVLLHLLADNAAHAGHLDIARELADGGVWDFETSQVRVPPPAVG